MADELHTTPTRILAEYTLRVAENSHENAPKLVCDWVWVGKVGSHIAHSDPLHYKGATSNAAGEGVSDAGEEGRGGVYRGRGTPLTQRRGRRIGGGKGEMEGNILYIYMVWPPPKITIPLLLIGKIYDFLIMPLVYQKVECLYRWAINLPP